MKTVALIVAGGSSTRFGGDLPKQFQLINDKPILSHTIDKFQQAKSVDSIVIVVGEEYLEYTAENIIDPYDYSKVTKIVPGGTIRQQSVLNGLEALPISTKFVAIHDGARPLVSVFDIEQTIKTAHAERAAILAQKTVDTIKQTKEDYIVTTLDRDSLYQAQTPQVFAYELILKVHTNYDAASSQLITDDSSLIEQDSFKVKIVEATSPNFKITTRQDFKIASLLLNEVTDE